MTEPRLRNREYDRIWIRARCDLPHPERHERDRLGIAMVIFAWLFIVYVLAQLGRAWWAGIL